MIPFLLDHIHTNFDSLFPGKKEPPSLVPIKVPGKTGAGSKVNVLVFDGKDEQMLAACAFPRSPGSDESIAQEADNLLKFREALKHGPAAGTVPRVLFDGEIEDVRVLIQEGKPGISLQQILAAGAPYRKLFMICGAWLAELHAATTTARVKVAKEHLDAWLVQPLETLIEKNAFFDEARADKMRHWTAEAARVVSGREIPICGQHGDFNSHNILIHSRGIAVIDWEDALFECPPFLDLNQFIISGAHQLDASLSPSESMRRFALSRGAYRNTAHETASAYCKRLGIHPAFPMMMAPACMIHMANLYTETHRAQKTAAAHWIERLEVFIERCGTGEAW